MNVDLNFHSSPLAQTSRGLRPGEACISIFSPQRRITGVHPARQADDQSSESISFTGEGVYTGGNFRFTVDSTWFTIVIPAVNGFPASATVGRGLCDCQGRPSS